MTTNITRVMRYSIAFAAAAIVASCGGDSVVQPTFGSGCSAGSLRAGETVGGELGTESCSVPYHFWSGNEVSYETYRVTLTEGKGYWFYMRQVPNGDGENDLDALLTLYGRDESGASIPLAISDELGLIAQPLEYIPAESPGALLERLKTIVRDKRVELIVVGMPRNMDGSYGPAAAKAQEFADALKEGLGVPIRTWDERLTSRQAQRCLIEGNVRRERRKEKVDKTAAAILLQSYLDSVSG